MTDKTKQLSFVADADTLAMINGLKKDLKATTTTQVFRKALALAQVAVEQARGSDGVVTVRGKSQAPADEVSVALRA